MTTKTPTLLQPINWQPADAACEVHGRWQCREVRCLVPRFIITTA